MLKRMMNAVVGSEKIMAMVVIGALGTVAALRLVQMKSLHREERRSWL